MTENVLQFGNALLMRADVALLVKTGEEIGSVAKLLQANAQFVTFGRIQLFDAPAALQGLGMTLGDMVVGKIDRQAVAGLGTVACRCPRLQQGGCAKIECKF